MPLLTSAMYSEEALFSDFFFFDKALFSDLDDGIDYRGRNWSACHKDKVGIPYVSRQPI